MRLLSFIKKILDTVLAVGAIVSMVCMVVTVLIQVFARFFLPQAPAWTEEASRIFFIYITAFASGLALERNAFVSLGIIEQYCRGRLLFFVRLLVGCVSVFFALLISYVSFEFVEVGTMQNAPTLRFLTMDYVFISITLMMGMVGLYGVIDLLNIIKSQVCMKEKTK